MKTIKITDFNVSIEEGINFSRDEYNEKQVQHNLVPFDEFITAIAQSCYENNGTIEDAVYIAEDAFDQL